jgi:hypothetical protein
MTGLRFPSITKHRSSEPGASTLQVPQKAISGQAEIKLVLAELERDALTWRGGARIDLALEGERELVPRRCRLDVAAIEDDVVNAIDHLIVRKIPPWQPSAGGARLLAGQFRACCTAKGSGGIIRTIPYRWLEHQVDLGRRVDWQLQAISAQLARSRGRRQRARRQLSQAMEKRSVKLPTAAHAVQVLSPTNVPQRVRPNRRGRGTARM